MSNLKKRLEDGIQSQTSSTPRLPTPDQIYGSVPVPRRVRDLAVKQGKGILNEDGTVTIGGCHMTGAGLTVPETITPEQMNEAMQFLVFSENQLAIWMGDLLVACEDLKYGDITAIALHFGIDPATARNRASIMRRVKTSLRSDVLDQFPGISVADHPQKSHYELVAAMDEADQYYWLTQKIKHGWNYRQMRDAIRMREAIRAATDKPPMLQPSPFQKRVSSLERDIDKDLQLAKTDLDANQIKHLAELHRRAADHLEQLTKDS
ncbi:hypothetical protein G4Y79_20960 [Phototrophicus methaneseepsis]|uniref:Uncharacterized protein n=1 Tax=Phototrophicus methaneseepsis TaxID=2710758 RepID=A0A7S8E830_9CHLR|nr:hypothetical protein [Phototrophicus methaneseepsis]QPC82128.1 hypothetical protein G4Y79_20960 [Phototrophicus methaneseepsis]